MTTETLPPCPVCGGAHDNVSNGWVHCGVCAVVLDADAWRRLAEHAALARAVETLDARRHNLFALRTLEGDRWAVGTRGDREPPLVILPSLAAALIALAAEVQG